MPGGLPLDPDLDADGARRWDVALVVACGGAIGGLARWLVNEAVPTTSGSFPWSTFVENVLGSLLLGAVVVLLFEDRRVHRYTRPFLGIGVLGGFTTFSTYMTDTRLLLADGHAPLGLVYLFGSLLLGLLAAFAGLSLATAAKRRAGS